MPRQWLPAETDPAETGHKAALFARGLRGRGDAGAVKRQARLAGGLPARDDVQPLKPLSASNPRRGRPATSNSVLTSALLKAGTVTEGRHDQARNWPRYSPVRKVADRLTSRVSGGTGAGRDH
jgi:hypothetical protein